MRILITVTNVTPKYLGRGNLHSIVQYHEKQQNGDLNIADIFVGSFVLPYKEIRKGQQYWLVIGAKERTDKHGKKSICMYAESLAPAKRVESFLHWLGIQCSQSQLASGEAACYM